MEKFRSVNNDETSNHRLISVLLYISKILGRVMYNELHKYLNYLNILCTNQRSFNWQYYFSTSGSNTEIFWQGPIFFSSFLLAPSTIQVYSASLIKRFHGYQNMVQKSFIAKKTICSNRRQIVEQNINW